MKHAMGRRASAAEAAVLARTRGRRLEEMLAEVRCYGRRADAPADVVAFAEIEQELLNVRGKWLRGGMMIEEAG